VIPWLEVASFAFAVGTGSRIDLADIRDHRHHRNWKAILKAR
jgi:hypothetical protein